MECTRNKERGRLASLACWCVWAGLFGLSAYADEPPQGKQAAEPGLTGKSPAFARESLRYAGKDFAYWRDYLMTELKPERRIEAIRAMGAFGGKGYVAEAVAVLMEVAKDNSDEKVGEEMALTVQKMGSTAVPHLLKNLEHPGPRLLAENALLNRYASIPPVAVPTLIHQIQSKNEDLQLVAIRLLSRAIGTTEVPAREKARKFLLSSLSAQKTIDRLIAILVDKVKNAPELVTEIWSILSPLGSRAKAAVPALIRAEITYLREESEWNNLPTWEDRKNAYRDMGLETKTVVPVLVKEFTNQYPQVRTAAIKLIGQIGPEARTAVPAVLKALQDSDEGVRLAAVDALVMLEADAAAVVPALAKLATDEVSSPAARLVALNQLKEYGPRAEPALATLFKALKDGTRGGGESRTIILANFTPSVPRISDPRQAMILVLPKIAPRADPVVPVLTTILNSEKEEKTYRISAAMALEELGPAAKLAARPLKEALLDHEEDMAIRIAALKALAKVETEPSKRVDFLTESIGTVHEYQSDYVKFGNPILYHAVVYLGKQGPAAKKAVPLLIQTFQDLRQTGNRITTVEALAQIGPAARDALPVLREAQKQTNGRLRRALDAAIDSIEGKNRAWFK